MIRNQFKDRVDAERFVSTDVGGGSTNKEYVICHENIPCLIVHKSGKESLTIGKKTHWISHSIFMRTLKNPALDEIDRFTYIYADGTHHHFEVIWVKTEREEAGIVRADCVEREIANPHPERAAAPSAPPSAPEAPVVPALQASASGDPVSGEKPLTVQFTGGASNGVPPYTYHWDFDDGSPHTHTQNPEHEYTEEGNYNAKFSVWDSADPHGSAEKTVPIEVTIPALPPIPSEVYAHYHLNEVSGAQAADSSGNDRHGTRVNMEDEDWKAGKLNNCLEFDGGDEVVNLGNIANFERTDPFSLECWFKTDKKNHDMLNRMMIAQPYTGWCIFMNLNGHIEFYLISSFVGAKYILVILQENLADAIWHHLIVTYDGSSLRSGVHIYVDGVDRVLNLGADNLIASIQNDVNCQIAARARPTYHFEGLIDEVIIYDKELSPAQVAIRWNSGSGREEFPSW